MLLPVIWFIYNTIPQKELGTSRFKINYSYKLKTLFTLQQAKKTSETVKERMDKLI